MEDGGAIHQSEVARDIAGDDDAPALSSNALAALQEFLRAQEEERLRSEEREDDNFTLVSEDWRLSQFWYDRDTAKTVDCEVLTTVAGSPEARVACIACPTLYAYLMEDLPIELRNAYDVIVADPPYLGQESLEKVAQAMVLVET